MNSSISIKFVICIYLGAAVHQARSEVSVVGGPEQGLRHPFSVEFDRKGQLWGVEYNDGNRVFWMGETFKERFRFFPSKVTSRAKKAGDVAIDGKASDERAGFHGMHELAIDGSTIYLADTFNNRIRVFDGKSVSTFAGLGGKGRFQGENSPAKKAAFDGPHTVALSADKRRLLIADLGNRRVREIDLKTGLIRTVAGNGKRGLPEDGKPALEQPLVAPRAACYGKDGSIYIASREGHALRRVTPEGVIVTVVNKAGKKGYRGDGGLGAEARLNGPKHLCVDPAGNIVITDDNNHCIRVYKPSDGTIHLLAGVPEKGGSKIGKGRLDTELNRPHGARYDRVGNLYVADSFNHRILRYTE